MTRKDIRARIQALMDEVESEDDVITLSAAFFDACASQMLARNDGKPITQGDIEMLLNTFYQRLVRCYLTPEDMPS